MNRPNILLLTIDTLRTDLLGCYGSDEGLTPEIDRFAAGSIQFNQAITGGSWTQAAFPVMLTSTYASMYGGCLGPLSPARPSPIQSLADCGYNTIGLSTSPLLSRRYGYDRGFDTFLDLLPDESDPALRRIKGGESLLRRPITHSVSRLFGIPSRPARTYVSGEDVVDQIDRALAETSQPFFLWAHFMDTHWPYHIEETIQEPDRTAEAWKDLVRMHRINRKGYPLTPETRAHFLDLYKSALRYTSRLIGKLRSIVTEKGLEENTVIVLISDHGEEFKERNYWGHFEVNLFDEIVRVPWIIHIPGLGKGRMIDKQVQALDLMPTVLEMCGCPPVERLEGSSLTAFWNGVHETTAEREAISEMWRSNRHMVAVRTSGYKFIWDSAHPDLPQLYDLLADPGELRDISPGRPELVAHYQAIVEDHRKRQTSQGIAEESQTPEADQDVLRRLRDLGYLD